MDIKTNPRSTLVATASPSAVAQAAQILRDGGLVAFPTETVYGLGANAFDGLAVASIFAAKERPRFNPLIVHVLDQDEASEIVRFNSLARELTNAFWPGGLTLVLPKRDPSPLALLATAGLKTAAVRSPSNPIARALVDAVNAPIAAPSANRSGAVSATTAGHVLAELRGKIDMILDDGPSLSGLESTIVGFDDGKPILLRPGSIRRVDIEAITGPLAAPATGAVSASGMLPSHYAPRATLRLNASSPLPDEVFLAFGPKAPATKNPMRNLSPSGDLVEAAANFFAMLRQLDESGMSRIAVMPIPHESLGEAINDRLVRAAAPREL